MYLKSITVKGFKSFPDRTRLEFGPGVSVVVGPNGSGKSNVTDGVLWALGAPETSISRSLDRNGEGEYRLAGARCRLVDVVELLSDTGLGKEMHSVISQGRVEAIVTSKPRDPRVAI